jgi:hypothetical protein
MENMAIKQRKIPKFATYAQKIFGLDKNFIIFFPRGVLHIRTGPQRERLYLFKIPWVFITYSNRNQTDRIISRMGNNPGMGCNK